MHEKPSASLTKYILGFVFSVLLTVLAYTVVTKHLVATTALVAVIMVLASVQLVLQLVCFLHLGSESKPRWSLWAFVFMFFVLVVIVGGSLWIMYHLDYNMMTPHQMDQHMLKQSNKGF